MASRRDLLLGAVCLAGSGLAVALTPRRFVSLMPRTHGSSKSTPAAFATWDLSRRH